MGHDAALEAHEGTENAERAEHDPFLARVAITVAGLAVCAAVAGSLESLEDGKALATTSEAVLAQDGATDIWNEFQADSIKKHVYGIAAKNAAGSGNADDFNKNAKEYGDTQTKLRKDAEDKEKERDALLAESRGHEKRHNWLTGGATLFEIGIAMSTVAIITRRHWLWFTALGFGAIGAVLTAMAYIS